ncbi:MAG: ComEC/Rec2 family competence protein [Chloroflexi bacterium]|nr:ComEC/Rec2 family competence protein [Chloroflexota bacterium]
MALVTLASAWLGGIVAGLLLPSVAAVAPWWAAGLTGLAGLCWRQPRWRWALLAGGLLALGAWRGAVAVTAPDDGHVAQFNGYDVVLLGRVPAEAEFDSGGQRFQLAVESVVCGGQSQLAHGLVRVVAPRFPQTHTGDRLELTGRLEEPPDFDGFAYSDYLARQGIFSLIRYPRLTLLTPGQSGDLLTAISGVRQSLADSLDRSLPEPQSALAASLLLGDTSRLPDEVVAAFRATGTSHILAVSGWQVTIVVGLLSGLALSLRGGLLARSLLVVAGTVLYALLTGGAPAVARATLMSLAAVAALQLGRPRDGLAGLGLACLALTVWQPQMALDLGFQLSSLATLGLVTLAPRLLHWLGRWPEWLAQPLATTLAAQALVLPVVVSDFQQLSPVSLLVNLVAVPAVPGALEWSTLAAGLGLVWAPLGVAASCLAWPFLSALIWLVEASSTVPYASLNVGRPQAWLILAYYGVLLLWLSGRSCLGPAWAWRKAHLSPLPARYSLATAVALAALLLGVFSLPDDGELRASVLDVGQGDAILIESPAGYRVLVDGGPDGVAILNALGRRLPYWDKSLDLVVLTHGHDDHTAGLIDVLQSYQVRQVLQGRPPALPSPVYKRWAELLVARGIPVKTAITGQRVDLGAGARLSVLYAGEAWGGDDETLNDASIILALERDQSVLYLVGDAELAPQRILAASGQLKPHSLLKVPHHGAQDSLDPAFIRALVPAAALISVGQRNRFGHPAASTLSLLAPAPVYRTDLQGTTVVTFGENGWTVQTAR